MKVGTHKKRHSNEWVPEKKEMFEQAQLVLEFSSPRRIYILAQHDTDDYYKRRTEPVYETKYFLG